MMKKSVLLFVVGLLLLLAACGPKEPEKLVLATTTSTADSGLLEAILPDFEAKYNATVDVVAVGTGQAIALGEAGDADVILVHAREREDAFVADGYGINRQDVMYNDFIILGPADDPAGIRGLSDVVEAMARIAAAQAPFISRGDDSGTHIRELSLWEAAGIVPEGDWYQSIGQGMGATLTVADEQQAYTVSDRGTYLARLPEGLGLELLVQGDERLLNPYGVIAVNPELHPNVNADLAEKFIEWLISPETQAMIDGFQINGQQLFFATASQ